MQQGRKRRRPNQAELFETPSDRPSWLELPLHVRSAVIQELARLLRPPGRQQPQGGFQEVGDE